MNQLENLLIERQYLLSELELFQNPLISLVFALIAIMAIIWVFYKTWHRYCYTITGSAIIVMTILSIATVMYIYMGVHLERKFLQEELTLVEEALIRDHNHKL